MTDRSAEDLDRDPQVKPERLPPFLDKPVKSNDPKAIRKKEIDDKGKSLKQENDIREVLSTQAGTRFMARLLGEICYLDVSAFHPNNSTMCNIAGRRQVGQVVKELIRDCDFDLWVKVDRELEVNRPKAKKER
jgi:hypothetical protein